MRLRNKKTGKIWHMPRLRQPTVQEDDISFFACISEHGCSRGELFSYKTLDELNEEWEDYKPAEPLIKDEAKRSVFKAWAEILGRDLEKADFKYDAERNGFDCYLAESIIEFANGEGINCVDREIYTFRALCGEEEE